MAKFHAPVHGMWPKNSGIIDQYVQPTQLRGGTLHESTGHDWVGKVTLQHAVARSLEARQNLLGADNIQIVVNTYPGTRPGKKPGGSRANSLTAARD
jgi:hypothetical protein